MNTSAFFSCRLLVLTASAISRQQGKKKKNESLHSHFLTVSHGNSFLWANSAVLLKATLALPFPSSLSRPLVLFAIVIWVPGLLLTADSLVVSLIFARYGQICSGTLRSFTLCVQIHRLSNFACNNKWPFKIVSRSKSCRFYFNYNEDVLTKVSLSTVIFQPCTKNRRIKSSLFLLPFEARTHSVSRLPASHWNHFVLSQKLKD